MDWLQNVFGAALVALLLVVAVYYAWHQVWALRRLRELPDLPDAETKYIRRQAWRRLVCCGLMLVMAGLLIGVLIALEPRAGQIAEEQKALNDAGEQRDFTPEEKDFLHLWGGLWIAILLLLMAVIFLAAWDLWAIRLYSVREHRKIQADRRAMIERQAARMRRQRNGFDG